MKKVIAIIIVIIIIATVIGCQKTPGSPIVADKNAENMIKAAQASQETGTGEATAREKVSAPDKMEHNGTQGKLKVVVDAPVTVPDTDKIPVINVKSGTFSQDTVDRYWDALIGNTQMWELSQQPTKDALQQMIVNQKQMLAEAQQKNDTDQIKSLNDRINELNQLYQAAPETAEVKPATSQLKEMVSWDPVFGNIDTRYMGTSGYSIKSQAETMNSNYKWFSVSNPWTGPEGSIKSDVSPAKISYETSTLKNNYFSYGTVVLNENTVLDDSVKKLIKTTPAEARKKVDDFLEKTDTPMTVSSMKLINDANPSENKAAKHYAYEITCVRAVNGLTVAADPGNGADAISHQGGYTPKLTEPAYTLPWTYESMILRLDDDGFFEISWVAPLQILDAEVDDSKLLSFENIQAVFEKMMYVSYEPNIQSGYSMECDISDIRLEMMRVRKQNSDPNALEGLLIPVWNFYGTGHLYNSDGKLAGNISVNNQSLLCVNAIDGSIIDTRLGY